jgi:DNA polymerase III sliding clamp (beta) subunit (PCNA family)
MTKSATFEVATIADAIAKANRVAPTNGSSFDRAHGIVVELDPSKSTSTCIVKATDLEVTLRLELSVLSMGDEAATWRVPSKMLHGLISTMPIGSGSTVEFLDVGDSNLYMKCGKTKSKLRLVASEFPEIEVFDPAPLVVAPGLATRLSQVAWATDKKGSGILSGVHIDGSHLIGCDRASAAVVPCVVQLDAPVTAPLTEVAQIIKNTGEVAIGASDSRLRIMPDDHTQATCVLYAQDYPNVIKLLDAVKADKEFEFSAEPLMAMLDRTQVLMKDERLPATNIEIGDGYLKMSISTDAGTVIDELEIVGGSVGEPLRISFKPDVLRNAINASGRPTLKVRYGPGALDPLVLSDDSDFRALMMTMRVS